MQARMLFIAHFEDSKMRSFMFLQISRHNTYTYTIFNLKNKYFRLKLSQSVKIFFFHGNAHIISFTTKPSIINYTGYKQLEELGTRSSRGKLLNYFHKYNITKHTKKEIKTYGMV